MGEEQPLRSDYAGTLTSERIGDHVRLAGWVDRRRDHGGIIFFDLRDASGLVQVVVDPEQLHAAGDLKMEYTVSVAGEVRVRPEGTKNSEMATGEVEVVAGDIRVLSTADALPFMINDRIEIDERIRLQYRYLDLRRPRMAANLRARSSAVRAMRQTLDELGFLEIETPTLIRSTPEGARDMLVPSRLSKGTFYALPQSPQLFKQLLMVGGVDRYYQIARCYRDEDLRSDRQLEFTQLDIEGAFWGQEGVLDTLEQVIVSVVAQARGVQLSRPFPRLTYADSMARYGTDKPDLRFGMEIIDLGDAVAKSGFRAFGGALEAGGVVRGINAGPLGLSRSGLDGLVARAQELGAGGLVWMVVEDDGALRSPVAKFLTDLEMGDISSCLAASPGDTLLIAADQAKIVGRVLGQLRLDLGRPKGHDDLSFLWVVDFPVFEETEGGDLAPAHHPFTSPVSVSEMRDNPREAVSKAYDLVLNGSELGSGSVRIHDPEVQKQVFEVLGISAREAESRFGWFIKALRYGTPPHAGFAVGIDRLLAILQGEQSIRDVIPFPKTQTGTDPLTESPTQVDDFQLIELGIDLRPDVRAELSGEEDD
ncbi:MAG: aspartate--tRNA ligase [Acidimicrobiia bacterium]|nr:aspartate--tRNA ligase [Acidimicrobiia bacterium]